MTLFNAYKPKPIEEEYSDVLKQERIDWIDSQRPNDPYEIFGDIIESLIPKECPVAYVTEEGTRCLCSQMELIDYQSELLWKAKELMPEQHSHIFAYLEGPLTLETNERIDDILDNVFRRHYNLTW